MNELTKIEVAERLCLEETDRKYVDKLGKLGYLNLYRKGRRLVVNKKEIAKLLKEMKDVSKYEKVCSSIFDLWDLYQKLHFSFPGALKGQIGELKALMELIKCDEFVNSKILYFGGTTPKVDIIVDGKKVQVKTQYPDEASVKKFYWKHGVKAFGSPTVRIENRDTLHKNGAKSAEEWDRSIGKRRFGFDYLVLTIMRNKIPEFYVFDVSEVKEYFKSFGCYSGKYGDVTIIRIEKVEDDNRSTQTRKKYPQETYEGLFKESKDAWHKIASHAQNCS